VFAADVRLPGMVHAAIAHGPQGDCVLSSWDAQGAARVPGCLGVVHAKGWLAAIGVTWHAADRAVAAMEPRFRARGPVADGNAIDAALDKALQQGKAHRLWGRAIPPPCWKSPASPPAMTLPSRCMPRWSRPPAPRGSNMAGWSCGWRRKRPRRRGAKARGRPAGEADVVVYPMAAGGSFDARLDARIAGEAAALARATGKPVQLTWSRWQESLASLPRAPVSALLEAGMSPDKQQVLGWRSRIATPASLRETAARVLDGEGPASARRWQDSADPLALEGALPPYMIPNARWSMCRWRCPWRRRACVAAARRSARS
jgi:isoquinoline 1-oxidoreductase beta subunit